MPSSAADVRASPRHAIRSPSAPPRRRSCRRSWWCSSARWVVRRWPTLSRITAIPMAAAELASPAATQADRVPVPAYVPRELLGPLVPWSQRYVFRLAATTVASLDDLWDEALTALLRASMYGDPVPGACGNTIGGRYGQTAVRRACWRYVMRGSVGRPTPVPLEDAAACPELAAPSAEAEALAREAAARRAWILREQAALAAARGTDDTAGRLRAAASAADRVARRSRRKSLPSARRA